MFQLLNNDPSDDDFGGAPQYPDKWQRLGCRAVVASAALVVVVVTAFIMKGCG